MQTSFTLKPVEFTKSQTPKLIVSSQIKEQFPTATVEINGSIFHLAFDDQSPADQIGLSMHNQLLLFQMEDLPAQCTVNTYELKQEDQLSHVNFHLYYHCTQNELKREFSHGSLERKFREVFNNTYINNNQNIEFKFNKYLFDVRVEFLENEKVFGYIGENTVLKFNPESHQNFHIKKMDSSDEQTDQIEENPETSVYSKYREKIHNIKVGGLEAQLDIIARRVFASRSFGGALIQKIGIKHAKGILLYGPPGTGKTLLARELSGVLGAQYKIINGPEIMDKYYGEGQKKLRQIFEPAIRQWKQKKYESSLHVIIFDQIDSITKKRGGSDSALGDSLVNQLLTLIDGVDSPNNILIIGMTNRKDLIDDALLRAGRLEVHIEIFLPNLKGREEIFNIHLKSLKREGFVSEDVDTARLSKVMKNYTGAEIQELVRTAWSIAAEQNEKKGRSKNDIKITFEHFLQARNDFSPQFGQDEKQIENLLPTRPVDIQRFMPEFKNKLAKWCKKAQSLKEGKIALLVKGPCGSGKTSVAAACCKLMDVPFTKFVNMEKIYKLNENQKAQYLTQVFEDSKKCDSSLIILDDLLRLIEYVPLSSKYSNALLQRIQHIIKSSAGKGKKQIIVATSDSLKVLDELGLSSLFRTCVEIKSLNKDEVLELLKENGISSDNLEAWEEEKTEFTIRDILEIAQESDNS